MPLYARPGGSCAASTIGRRPSIAVPIVRPGSSKRTHRLKIIVPLKLSHPSIVRLRRSKRPSCIPQGGKMDINKYETMSVREPLSADGLRERVYDYKKQDPQASAGHASAHWVMLERFFLVVSLLIGAISHGYHLFIYPLYITDEGIYMQQAWSVLREGQLSPYTYYYDHAPAGWLVIAGWVALLPHQFETFGNAINTARVLMLLLHLASAYLPFTCPRRLSGSLIAAVVACFLFNLSPLAVFYHRQVLLDNLMVFWVLLTLYLPTSHDRSILTPLFHVISLRPTLL